MTNLTRNKNVYYIIYLQRHDNAHDKYLDLESFRLDGDRLAIIKHIKKLIAESLNSNTEIVDVNIYAQIDLTNGENLSELIFQMSEY